MDFLFFFLFGNPRKICDDPEFRKPLHSLWTRSGNLGNFRELYKNPIPENSDFSNLGVSGQYFIKALEGKKNGKFITLEGVKGLCEIAENQFESLADPSSFEVLHGLYDHVEYAYHFEL